MTTYRIIRLPEKHWIGQGGTLGAAHLSRSGRWVDFRPAAETRCYHPLHRNDFWTADFLPPKGSGLRVFTVRYRTVKDVQYSLTPEARVKAQVILADPQCLKPLAAGEPPAEITITHPCAVAGWPLPPEIEAAVTASVAAARDDAAQRWAAHKERVAAATDTIEQWLESQPPQSQVRRWAQRWLTTGKAHNQLMEAALAEFRHRHPAHAIESALNTWREKVRAQWQ